MIVNSWELAKSEKYRNPFMKDGLIHVVSQNWNNFIHSLIFQNFKRIVWAKLDFSGIGHQVGLNFVKQTLNILNPILFTIVVKAEVLDEL